MFNQMTVAAPAVHSATVNLPPVKYFSTTLVAPWVWQPSCSRLTWLRLEVLMNRRIETSEGKVYRRNRGKDILCRLTYEVTPFRDGLFRWFLVGIEELE
jgi:hypothetical protein